MSVFVGLDCGGSSTRVLAIDESGKAVFRGQSGPANLLSTSESQVRTSLRAACHNCPKANAVFGSFAGLVDDEVRQRAIGYLKRIFPSAKVIRAEADYVAALAACGKETDTCVIAGTGSIVCSWRDGSVVKSGGRGPVLGDVGSASHIGRLLLNSYLDEPEKASTTLKKAVAEIFGSANEREIIRRLYGDSSSAAMLGMLGKTAAKEAGAGSSTAKHIIETEMLGLCKVVARHYAMNGLQPSKLRIGLAGGLWKSGTIYKAEFEKCLKSEMNIDADLFVLKKAPVEGAAALARESFVGN